MLLGTWLASSILCLRVPATALYVLGLGVLAYNAFFWWLLRRLGAATTTSNATYQWFARFQIGIDWLAMTLLVYLTGGIESPDCSSFSYSTSLLPPCCCHTTVPSYMSRWRPSWLVAWLCLSTWACYPTS